MALLEDLGKAAATPENLVIGVGVALLAPVLAPAVASVLRPTAKAMMRTGITVYRGVMEPLTTSVNNLVTEAQMELAAARVPRGAENSERAEEEDSNSTRSHRRQAGRSRS